MLTTTLILMVNLDWRLTLVALAVVPLFLLPTRRVGSATTRVSTDRIVEPDMLKSPLGSFVITACDHKKSSVRQGKPFSFV